VTISLDPDACKEPDLDKDYVFASIDAYYELYFRIADSSSSSRVRNLALLRPICP
jgi:hypothetical protein